MLHYIVTAKYLWEKKHEEWEQIILLYPTAQALLYNS